MNVRSATRKDIFQVANLMLQEFKKPPFNEKASLSAVEKSLKFYFRIGHIYVATVEKEIVGVLVFKIEQYWEGPVVIVEDLAVKENFKKQGIGKMLMSNIESYARKNKLKRVLFKTHKKSTAVKFYRKMGYKAIKNVINFEKRTK